jgi:hypothetical protein
VRTSVAEFDDGDEFLLWLELLEDFEPLLYDDKDGLSDSRNSQVADPGMGK